MGVTGLYDLITEKVPEAVKETDLKSYSGRRIAVDASISLYQFLIAIRYSTQQLTNSRGETTSHLSGFLYRTAKMLEAGIKPVFVFDGKPPDMKSETLIGRKERTDKAKDGLVSLSQDSDSAIKPLTTGEREEFKSSQKTVTSSQSYGNPYTILEKVLDQEEKKSLAVRKKDADKEREAEEVKLSKRTVRMKDIHIQQVKRLLRLLGVPIIDAPGEAEAQCAQLAKEGLVYGVATEDLDALTFGAPKMVRHMAATTTEKRIKEIDLQTVLNSLELTQEQLIDLSILLGCDYCPSIHGIGPKKGLKLLREHENIEKILVEKYGLRRDGTKIDNKDCGGGDGMNDDSESGSAIDDEDGDKKMSKIKGKKEVDSKKGKKSKEGKDKSKDVPDNWKFKEARKLFIEPDVLPNGKVTEADLKIRDIDVEGLIQFMVHENQFEEERIRAAIKRVIGSKEKRATAASQTRIDSYFTQKMTKLSSSSQGSTVDKPKGDNGKKSGQVKKSKEPKGRSKDVPNKWIFPSEVEPKEKVSQTRIDSFFKRVSSAPQVTDHKPLPVPASQQSPVKISKGDDSNKDGQEAVSTKTSTRGNGRKW